MMKNLSTIFFLMLLLIMPSCGDDNQNEPSEDNAIEEMTAEYYVKYEGEVRASSPVSTSTYTVYTDTGYQKFTASGKFSETFGPVPKGFHTMIEVTGHEDYAQKCQVRIYVCRGNEPFVLKAVEEGDKSAVTRYVIDF